MAAAPPPEPGLIEPKVEALIKATSIDFRIGGSRAFYAPAEDEGRCAASRPRPWRWSRAVRRHEGAVHGLY